MSLNKHGYPRPLILKNQMEVWLRPLEAPKDQQAVFDFFERLPPEDKWYHERDVTSEQMVRHYLLEARAERALPILAVDEKGLILGMATLNRYHPGARGHIGRLRVVLDPRFRSQRLGTYLLLDMIQLALDLGLSLLLIELIRGVQDQAIRALRKLDFFEQAVIKDYAKDPTGYNYDLVIMGKRLHQAYDDF